MNEFIQIDFFSLSAEQKDIGIARLISAGFEGFEETEDGLKAFIFRKDYDEDIVAKVAEQLETSFRTSIIEETNWNKLWESNFDPVIVGDFVAVRAGFHASIGNVQHELIVTPKMSFGTGHHATTYMMMQQMQHLDFTDKTVFDFGTGTGILAILAEKLGAIHVTAIDDDEWSIENAAENIRHNNCSNINLQRSDTPPSPDRFDIILANINKNVIIGNFQMLTRLLEPGGIMLLSGLLKEDEDVIFRKSIEYSLHIIQTTVRDNWLCVSLSC